MTNLLAAALPHGQFWAILPSYATATATVLKDTDYEAHLAEYNALAVMPRAENPVKPEDRRYEMVGTTAVMRVSGVMTKRPTSYGGTSTVLLRRAIEMAARDADAKAIMLVIDSPGGSVDGTKDLADAIAQVNASKRVTAYIDGQGCSAAYWIASQAGRIVIRDMSVTGSLGTMMVLTDSSKAAAEAGVEVVPITTGPLKGQPIPGVELDADVIAMYRSHVSDLNEYFKAAVSAGRGFSAKTTEALFTGATFLSKDALALGLVDRIGSLDDAYADASEDDDTEEDTLASAMPWGATMTVTQDPNDPRVLAGPITGGNALNPTISAREGGEEARKPSKTEPTPKAAEKPTMSEKQGLVAALRRSKLFGMATALVASEDNSTEGMAATMAAEVEGEVEKRLGENPVLQACAMNGVHSAADLKGLLDAKATLGRITDDVKAETHRLAIAAYGDGTGPTLSAAVDNQDYAGAVRMRDSFAATVDAKFPAGKRQSAPTGSVAQDVDAPKAKKSRWDRMHEGDQAKAVADYNLKTQEEKDEFAARLPDSMLKEDN